MARVKTKELKAMTKEEREKKLSDLKLELIKAKVSSSKTGSARPGEIRKVIARIHTLGGKK